MSQWKIECSPVPVARLARRLARHLASQRRVLLTLLLFAGGFAALGQEEQVETETEDEALPALTARHEWERPALLARESGRQQEFADRQLNQDGRDELVWSGEPDDRNLMLFRSTDRQPAKGVVVLLFGRSASFNRTDLAGTLRQEFPRLGWHTLALGLPDAVQILLPLRKRDKPGDSEAASSDQAEQGTEQEAEKANETSGDSTPAASTESDWQEQNQRMLQEDRQLIARRLTAALQLADQKKGKGRRVIIASRDNVAWLSWYLGGGDKDLDMGGDKGRKPGAVALVDFNPGSQIVDQRRTHELIRQITRPLLILQRSPFGWQRDLLLPKTAELHLLPGKGADEKLIRTLRGWLKRQSQGNGGD